MTATPTAELSDLPLLTDLVPIAEWSRDLLGASRALLARHGVATALIEPAGHWVYLDQPDAFVTAVQAFVSAR